MKNFEDGEEEMETDLDIETAVPCDLAQMPPLEHLGSIVRSRDHAGSFHGNLPGGFSQAAALTTQDPRKISDALSQYSHLSSSSKNQEEDVLKFKRF